MNTETEVSIRRAGSDDAGLLLPMVEEFYAGPEYDTPKEALARHLRLMLDDERSGVFLAEQGGEGVGFAGAILGTGLEFGTMAEVEDLFVKPGCRGHKVGSRLMMAIMDWCRDKGADEIFLVIAQHGEPARQLERLYLRLGFQPSRRRLMYRPLK